MSFSRTARLLVGGLTAAAVVALSVPSGTADAAKGRRKGQNRGALRMVDINVDGFAGIPRNFVIEMRFTSPVAKGSIDPALFQIRGQNVVNGGFTQQVPGDFQAYGNVVRFYPRLPTNLRDPGSAEGAFYPEGDERDDAMENSGLQAGRNYQITLVGNPNVSAIRSRKNRPLNRTYSRQFTTAPDQPRTEAFTISTYTEAPPPGFEFSNPPDKVASVEDQYALHGGTVDVPNDVSVTLFGNRVPLSPPTVRQGTNVQLELLERRGDPSLRKPVAGTPFIEQNFDTTRLVYQPRFPLPDVGIYALRVSKDVKDLTEVFTFKNNPERLRLREIYDFLVAARANAAPGTPPSQLPDPPPELVFDWPTGTDEADRVAQWGVLKGNVLALGDTHPDETDPRVMVLFSTRDEPVSSGKLIFEFLSTDGLFDPDISTASWDGNVPGAVAAISTIAGGSAVDGDFEPGADTSINIDAYPGRTINWRRLVIPPGVTVTLTGTRPATIKALEIDIQGTLAADGYPGDNAATAYGTVITKRKGGKGGPGGGAGGDSNSNADFQGTGNNNAGGTGNRGVDFNGNPPVDPLDAGSGGLGGMSAVGSTAYSMGGGGGGGGARTAGTAGSNATAPYASWTGLGGQGGAGSANDDLVPLFGGAGGGAGGHGMYQYYSWIIDGAGAGGGGGAMLVQTATVFNIGVQGLIRARGGRGGNGSGSGSTLSAGPGGGAGGGSLLLRSSAGFNFTNAASNFDVRGGTGGTQSGNYVAPSGGTGGTGYVRVEDPFGGTQVAGGSTGVFNPIGGGVPSYAYSKWADIGVEGPQMVNFTENDFTLTTAGNDALYVEMQFAIEDTTVFGAPKLDALTPTQGTTDESEISNWLPIKLADDTGIPGGAFKNIPGYDPGLQGNKPIFEYASKVNGKNYKFVRLRVYFQLDNAQSVGDPFPNMDRLILNFLFNN